MVGSSVKSVSISGILGSGSSVSTVSGFKIIVYSPGSVGSVPVSEISLTGVPRVPSTILSELALVVAVFTTYPVITSARVITYEPVELHVTLSHGFRGHEAHGALVSQSFRSFIVISVSTVGPVFVTTKLYSIVSHEPVKPSETVSNTFEIDLIREIDGRASTKSLFGSSC